MLHVTVADRVQPLAERLADVLRHAAGDPMQPEWIATPGGGLRSWLWLRLAEHLGAGPDGRGDGVAANLTAAFPGTLRTTVLDALRVADGAGDEEDPWSLAPLTWTVLAVLGDLDGSAAGLDGVAVESVGATGGSDGATGAGRAATVASVAGLLRGRFGDEAATYRRARRLADLLDRYHLHRSDLVVRWAAGHDVDVLGNPLAAHQRWQPALWRLVRERIGVPSPPEALPVALDRLRAGDLPLDLPPRLSVFGLPSLPGGAGFVDLAAAVARERDVHLFLLDPSPPTSAAVVRHLRGTPRRGPRRRSDDLDAELVRHPLLRSWARLPRETAVLLADAAAEVDGFPEVEVLGAADVTGGAGVVGEAEVAVTVEAGAAGVTDVGGEDATTDVAGGAARAGGAATLLGRLQADLAAGVAPAGTFRPAEADGSIGFHTAHGRGRQVEVARDVILHALAADPTLTEDDVLVVCPAIGAFEPLIRAGFGPPAPESAPGPAPEAGEGAEAVPALRYRIADRSIGFHNPVVAGLDAVLDLVPGRIDAVALQNLLSEPAVRARFRFGEDDLVRIADWVELANVRWGLDPEHRAAFGMPPAITANSWGAALDRLLLGATLPDDDLAVTLGGVAPLGIEGDDVDLAGRLADLLDHLRGLARAAGGRRRLPEWLDLLRGAVDGLLAPTEDDDRQVEAVRRALAEIGDDAAAVPAARDVLLDFADVRTLLRERLADGARTPPFFRGGVTVTSPDSLRGVPYRVVVLLGMDQSAFGAPAGDGDDLTAALALLGDREPRADRRQAILDAMLAAGDRLVVIRDGHDLRTNQVIPPAVVVAELQDLVRATLHPDVRDRPLEVRHPRQGFDDRCFVPGALGSGTAPWSFDPAARRAAEARRRQAEVAEPFLPEPLPDRAAAVPARSAPSGGAAGAGAPIETFELAELAQAVTDPVRRFLDRRLQVRLPEAEEAPSTVLPVELKGLERWQVGDRLITALRRGVDLDEWVRSERRRGSLPPGGLGADAEQDLRWAADALLGAAERLGVGAAGGPDAEPVAVDLLVPMGAGSGPAGGEGEAGAGAGGEVVRIVGSVEQDFAGPHRGPARLGFGSMKEKYRLVAWLDLLALVATDPEASWQAAVVNYQKGKRGLRGEAQVSCIRPSGADPAERRAAALDGLRVAVDIARRSRCEPLPIFPTFSAAAHRRAADGKSPLAKDWRSFQGWGDGDKPQARLVFGDLDHHDVLALPCTDHDPFGPAERAGAPAGGDRSRVLAWARRLWDAHDASVVEVAEAPGADGDAAGGPVAGGAGAGSGGAVAP